MKLSDTVIKRYGDEIRVCSGSTETVSRGFVWAKSPENADIVRRPLPAGITNDEAYMLIAAADAMDSAVGEKTLVCRGLEYEILRTEPIFIGTELSHWESVMRLKGAADNV